MFRAAAIAVLAFLLQEPPADISKLLDAAEKLPLTVPAFPDAVAKVESVAGSGLRVDLKHRLRTLRARATVLKCLHIRLTAMKGTAVEIPLSGLKPVSVRIVEVTGSEIRVARSEGTQTVAFGELDPEWCLSECRLGFATEPDASMTAGLWLAASTRWAAAFRELAGVTSDHPLVLESKKRGVESLVAGLDSSVAGRRWKEAAERAAAADKVSDDPLVADARERVVRAIAEQAKEHSRKSSKKSMEDMIDLIVRHFPGREALIEEIREESRWITITDPKKFGLTSKDGQILLDPGDEKVEGAYCDVDGTYDGISVRVQLTKTSKEAHGGPIWMGRDGRMHVWMIRDNPFLMVGRLDEKVSKWHELGSGNVESAATYEITALLEKDGVLAIRVNGAEIVRVNSGETAIKSPGVQASYGRMLFDRFRLRKKK